jgi:Holliday junction resolvase RusA-like endonuclease
MAIDNILDNIINKLEWDIELIVYGEPASKANSRRLVRKRFGNRSRMISIKSEKALAYEKAFASQCLRFDPLIEGDILLYCRIFYASRRPDLDESLIMDGLQGLIIKNDRQIKGKIIVHGLDREKPRTHVGIKKIA